MKILMTDDDRDDRNLSKLAFERIKSKHEIDFAIDGDELIAKLEIALASNQRLPDKILLDLNMPKKNGIETLKAIRIDLKLKDLNIIIFTTSQSEKDRIESLNNGANQFIIKPSNFNNLVEVFKEICEES